MMEITTDPEVRQNIRKMREKLGLLDLEWSAALAGLLQSDCESLRRIAQAARAGRGAFVAHECELIAHAVMFAGCFIHAGAINKEIAREAVAAVVAGKASPALLDEIRNIPRETFGPK